MPRWAVAATAILIALAVVPFALIARARARSTGKPRVHIIRDMDSQPKYKTQSASPLFADGRAMRPRVEGTVARGELADDPVYHRGIESDEWTGEEPPWADRIPVAMTPELMHRGRQRFEIFCATCHGLTGEGNGPVAVRANELEEGTWIPPTPFHSDEIRNRPPGHIFNTITRGVRSMPAYGIQVPVADRWAIVAYVRALQRSRNAAIEDVPAEDRAKLRQETTEP